MPPSPIKIAVVGDFDPEVAAHRAIPRALENASAKLGVPLECHWVATDALDVDLPYGADGSIGGADGIWCAPASPYRSTEGALRAIRFARESKRPFLGTCGGFQHAVLEFARNVLGWSDAAHAEIDSNSSRPVIAPLACALVEQVGAIRLVPGTRLALAYGAPEAHEAYRCRYGLAPGVRDALEAHGVVVSATDEEGDVRAIELEDHPFFVATLFQHERAALRGEDSRPAEAFVSACAPRGLELPNPAPGP